LRWLADTDAPTQKKELFNAALSEMLMEALQTSTEQLSKTPTSIATPPPGVAPGERSTVLEAAVCSVPWDAHAADDPAAPEPAAGGENRRARRLIELTQAALDQVGTIDLKEHFVKAGDWYCVPCSNPTLFPAANLAKKLKQEGIDQVDLIANLGAGDLKALGMDCLGDGAQLIKAATDLLKEEERTQLKRTIKNLESQVSNLERQVSGKAR